MTAGTILLNVEISAIRSAVFGVGSGSGVDFQNMSLDSFMNGFSYAMVTGTALASVALVLSTVFNENRSEDRS